MGIAFELGQVYREVEESANLPLNAELKSTCQCEPVGVPHYFGNPRNADLHLCQKSVLGCGSDNGVFLFELNFILRIERSPYKGDAPYLGRNRRCRVFQKEAGNRHRAFHQLGLIVKEDEIHVANRTFRIEIGEKRVVPFQPVKLADGRKFGRISECLDQG
jgi:hypothetical protein